jgi:hypothetical protein
MPHIRSHDSDWTSQDLSIGANLKVAPQSKCDLDGMMGMGLEFGDVAAALQHPQTCAIPDNDPPTAND